ncbi:MAG: hypothetical protein C4K58_04160 [Flavobacteriaceae bacterium]|nr:MAG: hypothetical protein C4K58_04160 [Flavobacteriaceae bacterium]
MNKAKNLFNLIMYSELPKDFSGSWVRPVAYAWGILFVGLVIGFYLGLSEFITVSEVSSFLQKSVKEYPVLFVMLVLGFGLRIYIAIMGIKLHKEKLGYEIEDRTMVFMTGTVWFQFLFAFVMYWICGLIFVLMGKDYSLGYGFKFFYTWMEQTVDKVPTLFSLEKYQAVLISYVIMCFIEYSWHRLSHESRLLWLLAHRPHHVPPTLASASHIQADPWFVLGKVWQDFAYILVGGILTKLFNQTGDMFFLPFVYYRIIVSIFSIFDHTSAYYEQVRNNKFLYPIFVMCGNGPFHYYHHSALAEHTVVNIQSGPFMFMDRLFGTYATPSKKKPPVGLTGQPELYHNPINLALSGLFQILYELRYNSIKLWPKIIFGGVYYIPPFSKSFCLKDEKAYYGQSPKVKELNPEFAANLGL